LELVGRCVITWEHECNDRDGSMMMMVLVVKEMLKSRDSTERVVLNKARSERERERERERRATKSSCRAILQEAARHRDAGCQGD
jgi:hypothetical protein